MMRIECPWCGLRDADEFAWHGEHAPRPSDRATDPVVWRRWLHERDNPSGWSRELWLHRAGCRRWLVVERHTTDNTVRSCVDVAAGGRRS